MVSYITPEFPSPSEFLSRCTESSQTTYDLFKQLADHASHPTEQSAVRQFLTKLKIHCENLDMSEIRDFSNKFHFSFVTLTLDGSNHADQPLTLLQFPSIFAPEDWSFTFYEGLARYPVSEFQGRSGAELGCGNGWISIALARKNLPQKLLGLDINPRAIICARLNLILNALDESGTPIIDAEGKTLLDRVEFHVSDLLSFPIEKNIPLDRVIGCIPQVLSPEPLLAEKFAHEYADDQFLYSLSNYCEKQGYIEDQFGLGLIARALEEAISICKPSAKIILNMGGRPGEAVLDRLFARRGFSIRKIWSTKVWQASDTDIQPLVNIEKATPHRFEFFTSLSSDEPICAQTAQAYANQDGKIAHSLCVYEARLKDAAPIKSLFKLLNQPGFEDSRNGLDLSFTNDDVADEKTNFIGNISEWLQQKPNLPYFDTEGEPQLRRQIAQFLRSYWRIPLTAKSVFIAPNRRSLIKNHLQLFQPKLTLIDRELNLLLGKRSENEICQEKLLLESPRRIDEMCKLIERLKPNLVITSLQDFEIKTSDAFVRLCEACKANSSRVLIDLSQQFNLSSQPGPHGVLAYLADHELPEHVSLLFGLVKNRVYNDLELSFLISENQTLLEHLSAAAELTYSRAPLLTQKYYSRIFSDLLNFQLTDLRKGRNTEELRLPKAQTSKPLSSPPDYVQKAFCHPSIRTHHLNMDKETVRLDYGENCLKSPPHVHAAIMESFLRQNITPSELNVERAILDFSSHRFGFDSVNDSSVVLGNGVAPLFAATLELISEHKQKIMMPQGAYGYFLSACDFFNAASIPVKTSAQNQFKVTAQELDATLSVSGAHWLYLNAPIVNPTGAVYSSGELAELAGILRQHNCGLILDTVFSGLEFNHKQTFIHLNKCLSSENSTAVQTIILGGLSKELAAGGLRFGWALCNDDTLSSDLRTRLSSAPHLTTKYAARRIYQALCSQEHPIHAFLDEQRSLLQKRSQRLSKHLNQLGWDVVDSEGGLFVCASPNKYIELIRKQQDSGSSFNATNAADTIAHRLFHKTGLLLNNATWTGLPSHLRFVISVDENDFELALNKLKEFDACWQ